MGMNREAMRITRQVINEELSRGEVEDIITYKIEHSDAFKKRVKDIMADAISNLFKEMFQRDSFWKQAVKK